MGGLPTASRRFTQPFVGPVKEFSSELRLESFGNSFFDWAFGGYYYDRTARQLSIVGNGPEQRAKSLNNINEEEATQKSVFALTSFHLTRTLELEAQGRWTWEDKSAILTNALPAVPVVRSPAADFSYGTYRLTGSWRWLDDNTLYAVVASGTKSGGFNNTVILSEQSFGPEKNTTFEIGSKNQLFNRTLTLNASAYYIDWSNLQLPVPSAVAGQVNFVRNIGSATVKGFEIFAAARPVENLDVSLGYSYTDPKWKKGTIDFSSARACATPAACGRTPLGGGIDIGGFQIPRTSRHQLTAAGTFTIPLQDSELYIRGDASYRSSQVTLSAIALQRVPAQTLVNGRVGWVKENHEISLFVKNAFDKSYIISSINEPEFFPVTTFTTGFLGNGRIIGLTLETGF